MIYELSGKALTQIEQIIRYTDKQFGEEQTREYISGLYYSFDLLSDNPRMESSELRNSLAHHGGVLSRIIESGAIEIDNLVSHAESFIVDDDRAAENV